MSAARIWNASSVEVVPLSHHLGKGMVDMVDTELLVLCNSIAPLSTDTVDKCAHLCVTCIKCINIASSWSASFIMHSAFRSVLRTSEQFTPFLNSHKYRAVPQFCIHCMHIKIALARSLSLVSLQILNAKSRWMHIISGTPLGRRVATVTAFAAKNYNR